jgi:hypothetical protein
MGPLYHGSDHNGSDHIIKKPHFMGGKEDNDYGNGFYTTEDQDKAEVWVLTTGNESSAVCNQYDIDADGLSVIDLDTYGPLAWIAEIIEHRGTRTPETELIGQEITKRYKIDTDAADIIVGYRADDSYIDVVDAFLKNQVSVDEIERLFHEGNLGRQVFIKSQRAFDRLTFTTSYDVPQRDAGQEERKARTHVAQFLSSRNIQVLLHGFAPSGFTAADAVQQQLSYDTEYHYYYPSPQIEQGE